MRVRTTTAPQFASGATRPPTTTASSTTRESREGTLDTSSIHSFRADSAETEARSLGDDDPLFDRVALALASRKNIAHVERALDPSIVARCAQIASERSFRRELVVGSDARSFDALFANDRFDDELRAHLQGELSRWTALFCALVGRGRCKVTLASVWTDSCRKFHADFVALRMLCTFAGPATEFVDDAHVRRDVELDTSRSIEAIALANAQMVVAPSSVRQASVGDLLFLKGELWPGNRGRGAMHRSPPIERSSDKRLLLVLDVLNPALGEHEHDVPHSSA